MTQLARALDAKALFSSGKWRFPAQSGTVLLWYGANGATEADEKDHSLGRVAETLAASLDALRKSKALGKIQLEVFRGHDKEALFSAFDRAGEGSVIQVHYFGHGNPGGLYCGYGDPDQLSVRKKIDEQLVIKRRDGVDAAALRAAALTVEPSFITGLLDIDAYKRRAQRALHGKAFVLLWGCFSGAEHHAFDDDSYWRTFQAGAARVDGVAKHIAKVLGRPVIAARDVDKVHGTNFWYRTTAGNIEEGDVPKKKYRPDGIPQWLWPAKGAEWVTFDAAGKAGNTEAGGPPAQALTALVGGATKAGRGAGLEVAFAEREHDCSCGG